jgi:hypothetical protein
MSVFDIAMNTLFADPNLREVAIYLPMQGDAKKVFIISYRPSAFTDISGTFIASPTLTLDVRVTDCPAVLPGDKFLVAGKTYTVQAAPRLDSGNLTWRVDLA